MADSIRQIWIGKETIEGTLASYMRCLPCADFKPDGKDGRFVPKEYQGTRIRERKSTRVKKYSEISAKVYAYYELAGWLYASIFNNTTSSTAKALPAVTSNVQTISFTSFVAADTYTLRIDGYQTPTIAYNATPATNVTNIQNAINSIPSVVKTANATVAGTGPYTITFASALASKNIPLITATVVSSTAGTISVTNTTPGVGVYDHTWKGGTSSLPTLSLVYYDGVSYKSYVGCSIDSLDFTFTVDKDVEIDIKAIGRMEVDQGTLQRDGVTAASQALQAGTVNTTVVSALGSTGAQTVTPVAMTGIGVGTQLFVSNSDGFTNREMVVVTAVTGSTFTATFASTKGANWLVKSPQMPELVVANYNQPIEPQQLTLTINGSSNTSLISGKISCKGNRQPLHTINQGTEMKRATEGEFQVSFDLQFDYTAYAGSQYANYISNTSPGAIVITATDSNTSLGSSTTPVMTWTLPNPIITDGNIDSSKASDVGMIKGIGALDTSTNTNITVTATNEVPAYSNIS